MSDFFQDKDFQQEPYATKFEVANNYFNQEIAVDGFDALAPAEQEKIKNNFILEKIGGDPYKKKLNIKEGTANMYYDSRGLGWNEETINEHPEVFKEMKQHLSDEAKRLQDEAMDRVKINMSKDTIKKLTEGINANDNSIILDVIAKSNKFDEAMGRGVLRYPLGVGKVGEDLWNKIVDYSSEYKGFDWLQKTDAVSKFIQSNEASIKSLETQLGYTPSSLVTPSGFSQFAAETFGIAKLMQKGLLTTSAGAGAMSTTGALGAGEDWRTSILQGTIGATTTLVGGAVFKGIENMVKGGKSAEDVIDFIKKHDEVYNNDDAINIALQKYYKVFQPSNNVAEDKVRALIYGSEKLGSEMKIGADVVSQSHDIIQKLRQQTNAIKTQLQDASFSPTGITDAAKAIEKARNSTAYGEGMNIIRENFNADVPLDKKVWSKFASELNNISQLAKDDVVLNNLNQKISNALKSDNPTIPLTDLIDWEQDIGKIAFSKYGSKQGFKISMGDKYISNLVEGALKQEPEGLALYRTMKDIYKEVSVFKDSAKAQQSNMIGKILTKLNNKDITYDTAVNDLLSLKKFGENPIGELAKVGGADMAQKFENALINNIISKQSNLDYAALAKQVNKIGFITKNGKQLQAIINNLNDALKSEKIDDRLRQLVIAGEYDGTTITADILAKAKYTLAGNIWNRLKSWVLPSAREAKNVEEILKKTGDILQNPNALKSFSRIDDLELRKALDTVTKARVETYSKAKQATNYEAIRAERRAENQARMLQAAELAKLKKAGNLGFGEGTPSIKKELP